uniref:Reverse transcriptase domain-containing protein n=1 Tax=Haemonchus contortus TaxID=6289 RepID=A0A7I4YUW1_HAECO
MDVITEELLDGPLKTILYADDIALVAESNVKKSKFFNSEECMESIVDGHGEAIEKVHDLRYLGSDLDADGSVDQAVKSRINAARSAGSPPVFSVTVGAPELPKERCIGQWYGPRCCTVASVGP